MEELIAKLQEKAQACGYKTKEDRARKGAYVDCIMELKEALRIHAVSGSTVLPDGWKVYVCTDCHETNVKKDNRQITVGLCDKCEHPLWNDDVG